MTLRNILYCLVMSIIVLSGCETLKSSKPIKPIKKYERMLVGRFDANYVGTDNCLSACHYHDKIKNDFDASTMGTQLTTDSGMALVNCESCHGPGSLAIEGLTPEKVAKDAESGKKTACAYDTLIILKELPPQALSLICLKCHTANATFNLHNWNAGAHSINDVSCSNCHDIHMGPDLIARKDELAKMCEGCHKEIEAEFSLPSHHPVPEKKVFCTNCHDPHGSLYDNLLRKDTVKQTCTECHAEKEGPFVFEHAEISEDCLACHSPHGSVNDNLLNVRLPFLCLQCHPVHRTSSGTDPESKGAFNTRCTDCHSQIHGSDIPSSGSGGTFTH